MPLTGNPEHDIPTEIEAGKPRKQAVAIALSEQRRKGNDMRTLRDALLPVSTIRDDHEEAGRDSAKGMTSTELRDEIRAVKAQISGSAGIVKKRNDPERYAQLEQRLDELLDAASYRAKDTLRPIPTARDDHEEAGWGHADHRQRPAQPHEDLRPVPVVKGRDYSVGSKREKLEARLDKLQANGVDISEVRKMLRRNDPADAVSHAISRLEVPNAKDRMLGKGAVGDDEEFKPGDKVTTDVTPQVGIILSVAGSGDKTTALIRFGAPDKYGVADVRKLYTYLLRKSAKDSIRPVPVNDGIYAAHLNEASKQAYEDNLPKAINIVKGVITRAGIGSDDYKRALQMLEQYKGKAKPAKDRVLGRGAVGDDQDAILPVGEDHEVSPPKYAKKPVGRPFTSVALRDPKEIQRVYAPHTSAQLSKSFGKDDPEPKPIPTRVNPAPFVKTIPRSKRPKAEDGIPVAQAVRLVRDWCRQQHIEWNPIVQGVVEDAAKEGASVHEICRELRKFYAGHEAESLDQEDLNDAMRVLGLMRSGKKAKEIAAETGLSLQFVLDVGNGKYGRSRADIKKYFTENPWMGPAKDGNYGPSPGSAYGDRVVGTEWFGKNAAGEKVRVWHYDDGQAELWEGTRREWKGPEGKLERQLINRQLPGKGQLQGRIAKPGSMSARDSLLKGWRGKDSGGPEKLDIVESYRGHSIWKVKTAGGAIRYMPVPQGGGVAGLYGSPQELKDEIDRVNTMHYANAKDLSPIPVKRGKDRAQAADAASPSECLQRAQLAEIRGQRALALDAYRFAAAVARRANDKAVEQEARDGIAVLQAEKLPAWTHPSAGKAKAYDSAPAALLAAVMRTRAGERVAVTGTRVAPTREVQYA